ncbi:aspartate/glutamate racemase family protein [Paralimibaculum aggregatum]|uniref:Aspartate/glutamate racemase family protein n=1 Tax=Paralimibaculum aggregatum TaxID=3036245 RepID=A0ABQ6LLQ6_9RHOB|nr:aspartate/glutamate racemase family protein [Limibaculum sp. NKW23]GMG83225.1 aspartate/glutamate racemase family protein [Limibaculum sp. NKW23]
MATTRSPQPPAIGILMLDTRFPRPPGDIGNPETWPFPVRFARVPGAAAAAAVRGAGKGLLAPFVEAGRGLVAEGCRGIATSCGFLAPLQRPLAEALGVPVLASALMQAGAIAATLPPGRRLGVLTIEAASLSPELLAAAGVPAGTAVRGMPPGGALAGPILGGGTTLDTGAAEAEVVAAATALAAEPGVGAILLECTNLPPYARAAAEATGLPVHSIVTALTWFAAGLAPPRW